MEEVTIYTRKMCGYCSAAKILLKSKGVTFSEHDGTWNQQVRAEMIERTGGARTFPQIFIGNTHVGGCDELHELERVGSLDTMLKG